MSIRVSMVCLTITLLAAGAPLPAVAQDDSPYDGVDPEPEVEVDVAGTEVESPGEEEGADAPEAGEAGEETVAEAVASKPGKEDIKVPAIIKKIKALQAKIKQSQQRMDDVVGIVLSTSETKGARAVIALENEMVDFTLVQAVISLDGAPIFKKSDEDGLLESGEMEVFNGAILPGEHQVSVLLVYKGTGYGIFSYLQGYRFKVRSSQKFTVKEGDGAKLTVIGYERKGEDLKMEEKPAIKYLQEKLEID